MKAFALLLSLLFLSCGLGSQKKELETLAQCTFTVHKINRFDVAGVSLTDWVAQKKGDFTQAPGLVFGFLQKSLPLEGQVEVKITNPTTEQAALQAFSYEILLEQVEIAKGKYEEPIKVAPSSDVLVPLTLHGDLYELIAAHQEVFLQLLQNDEAKATLTIKIKPSIMVAGQLVESPTFFSFNRELNRSMFLK